MSLKNSNPKTIDLDEFPVTRPTSGSRSGARRARRSGDSESEGATRRRSARRDPDASIRYEFRGDLFADDDPDTAGAAMDDPDEEDDGLDGKDSGRKGRKSEKSSGHPVRKALAVLLILALVAGLLYGAFRGLVIPLWKTTHGPASIDQTQGDDASTGDDSQEPADNGDDGAGTTSIAAMAAEARGLDFWFDDIPESSWIEKTSAELNGSPTMALGAFCEDRLVVLQNGTVIAHGYTGENNEEKIPIIITDYVVKPAELYGHVLVFINEDSNIACSVAQVSANAPLTDVSTSVFLFNLTTGEYEYQRLGKVSIGG